MESGLVSCARGAECRQDCSSSHPPLMLPVHRTRPCVGLVTAMTSQFNFEVGRRLLQNTT